MKQVNRTDVKHLLSFICICIFLFSFPIFSQAQDDDGGSQYIGKDVFAHKGCINCHSINGEGGDEGPDLGKIKFYGTNLELAAKMWNHFPRMQKKMETTGQKFPSLTKDEMSSLIDYLIFMRYRGESGNAFRGRKLLHSMDCFECHMFGGEGGKLGPNISAKKEFIDPMKLVEAMWNHGPEMMPLFEENHIDRPEFYEGDIVDIATGIQSFMDPTKFPVDSYTLGNVKKGKVKISEKGCLECHSVNGSGGNIGPSFDDLDFNYTILDFAGQIWNHGPKMWKSMQDHNIEIPKFESGDLRDIISYLYWLKMQDTPGDPQHGQQLISEKRCQDCHSPDQSGNRVADIGLDQIEGLDSPVALTALMWSHAPVMNEKRIEKQLRWPTLTDRDMANLYAYLSSINP